MDTWDIWVFGGGPIVSSVLSSISYLLNDGLFKAMFRIMALIGFFVMITGTGLRISPNPAKALGYLIMVLAFDVMIFQARININIEDPISAQIPEDNTSPLGFNEFVPNVPLAIAAPAYGVSLFGRGITTLIETHLVVDRGFPESGTMAFGVGRFDFLGQLVRDMGEVRINQNEMKTSIANYVRDCVVPELFTGQKDIRQIRRANDLWPELQTNNQGRLTTYYEVIRPDGTPSGSSCASNNDGRLGHLTSCADAHQCIEEDIAAYTPYLMKNASGVDWTNTEAYAFLDRAMNENFVWMAGVDHWGGSGVDMIKQAAVINTFIDGTEAAPAGIGDELLFQVTKNEAKQAQRAQWKIAAEIFNETLGYIFVMIQVLLYAMAPIVLIMVLLPNFGAKTGMGYLALMFWIVLWQPTLSIINFMIASFMKLQTTTWNAAEGMYMDNIGVMSAYADNMGLAAGFLGTMVPVLTLGLIKGGEMAFTQFTSDAIAPVHANRAAANLASGSVDLENKKVSSFSANKFDDTLSIRSGTDSVQTAIGGGAGTTTVDQGGAITQGAGGPRGDRMDIRQEKGFSDSGGNVQGAAVTTTGGTVVQAATSGGSGQSSGTSQQVADEQSRAAQLAATTAISQASGMRGSGAESSQAGAGVENESGQVSMNTAQGNVGAGAGVGTDNYRRNRPGAQKANGANPNPGTSPSNSSPSPGNSGPSPGNSGPSPGNSGPSPSNSGPSPGNSAPPPSNLGMPLSGGQGPAAASDLGMVSSVIGSVGDFAARQAMNGAPMSDQQLMGMYKNTLNTPEGQKLNQSLEKIAPGSSADEKAAYLANQTQNYANASPEEKQGGAASFVGEKLDAAVGWVKENPGTAALTAAAFIPGLGLVAGGARLAMGARGFAAAAARSAPTVAKTGGVLAVAGAAGSLSGNAGVSGSVIGQETDRSKNEADAKNQVKSEQGYFSELAGKIDQSEQQTIANAQRYSSAAASQQMDNFQKTYSETGTGSRLYSGTTNDSVSRMGNTGGGVTTSYGFNTPTGMNRSYLEATTGRVDASQYFSTKMEGESFSDWMNRMESVSPAAQAYNEPAARMNDAQQAVSAGQEVADTMLAGHARTVKDGLETAKQRSDRRPENPIDGSPVIDPSQINRDVGGAVAGVAGGVDFNRASVGATQAATSAIVGQNYSQMDDQGAMRLAAGGFTSGGMYDNVSAGTVNQPGEGATSTEIAAYNDLSRATLNVGGAQASVANNGNGGYIVVGNGQEGAPVWETTVGVPGADGQEQPVSMQFVVNDGQIVPTANSVGAYEQIADRGGESADPAAQGLANVLNQQRDQVLPNQQALISEVAQSPLTTAGSGR